MQFVLPEPHKMSQNSNMVSSKPMVLVVEDEPSLRALVRKVLERHGFQVIDASSGAVALQLWGDHREKIDLLLTDMVMPDGVTGRELAEKLKADNPLLKVVYTTGYSAELLGEGIVLREGINFLQKPYPPQKLLQTIRTCLSSQG
jgi:two-component system, cell cycle sensor histidine kinase and response regulator CckA